MELNAEQIKKDLRCCTETHNCEECAHDNKPWCADEILKDALALINQLTEENERLRERITEIEANTVREMQERLQKRIASAEYRANTERKTVKKEELIEQVNWVLHKVVPDTIDQIAKEMTDDYGT